MASSRNKLELIKCQFNHPHDIPNLKLIGEDSKYQHEEAGVQIASFVSEMLPTKTHIHALAEDTDVCNAYATWLNLSGHLNMDL